MKYRVEYHVERPDARIIGQRVVTARTYWHAKWLVERDARRDHQDVVVDCITEVNS